MNLSKRIQILTLSFLFLIFFVALSKYEDRIFLRNLDFAVTTKIQDKIDNMSQLRLQRVVDNTMAGATFFASPEFTSVVILVLTGWLLYDWKQRKFRFRAFVIPIAFVAIVIIELYAKSIVHHPSPSFSMIKHTTSVFPANYVNEQYSYPSGHAARAVFLAIVSYFVVRSTYVIKQKKLLVLAPVLFGYVILVGVSRIYLGHHWFSDVQGGLLLGLAAGTSVLNLY